MPLVSVIIPTYNRADYLPATLDSVLGQSFKDFEVVVVDDGSTDETREVVDRYPDSVSYLYQENQREGAARNLGIAHSGGEFLAFLDSDDLWLPDKLEADLAAFHRRPEAALSYARVDYVSSASAWVGRRGGSTPEGDVFDRLVRENFMPLSTVTVRRSAFEAVGLFRTDPHLSGSFDWEAWVRLAAQHPVVHVPRVTTLIRVHESNMLSDGAYMERAMRKAVDLMLANPDLRPRLSGQEHRVLASLYQTIAINHCSNGQTGRARHFLRLAATSSPVQTLHLAFWTTAVRSLLGRRLVPRLGRWKRAWANRSGRSAGIGPASESRPGAAR